MSLISKHFNKIIYSILFILTFLATYTIVVVGLDISCFKIGTFDNADKINFILVNLSFSYIAGCIFYLLVTYLPHVQRRNNIRKAITPNLEQIQRELQIFFLYYSTKLNIPTSDKYTLDINIDELEKSDSFSYEDTTMEFSYIIKGNHGHDIPFGYNVNYPESFNVGHHLTSAKGFADVILDHKNIIYEDDVLIEILTQLTRSFLVGHSIRLREQNFRGDSLLRSTKTLSEIYILYKKIHKYIKHKPVRIKDSK